LLHRGQIHLTHDDVVAAVNDLRRAIAIGSTSATQFTSAYLPNSSVSTAVPPVAYACLGTALFKLEEGAVGGQAESTLQQALDTHPDSFEVLLYYGDIMAEKGDIVQAIQRFSEAHLMDPSSPLPFVHASRAYMTVRDLTLAEKHLRRALELDPTCSASYLDLGQVEVQRGRSEAALECLEKGMAQARYLPELQDALVFRRLATLQLEQKRKAAREG
jgi:tetratricopeptide (TPR) repeat protein